MLDIVLKYSKLSKLCFTIGKTFGLLELYVIVKIIISSLLVVFGCLRILTGISLALNVLASISNFGYFCSSNFFFSSLKRLSFTFPFSATVHIFLARENGIFVKQCREWFDVNGTYCFESVGLFKYPSRFLYHFSLSLYLIKVILFGFFHSELNIIIDLI